MFDAFLEALLKAFKWYIIMISAIIGTSAFIIASNGGSIRPVWIGVAGYGVVYGVSYFWKSFRGKLLLISVGVFLALSFLSPYVPLGLYVLFGSDPASFDPFYMWGKVMAGFGIPIMVLVFYFVKE